MKSLDGFLRKTLSISSKNLLFQISQYAIAFLLVAGIFLRFYNIDGKVYWRDEVFTSLQVSGQLLKVVNADVLFTGELLERAEIIPYQSANRSFRYWDTVRGLREFEPQLTPLYFLLLRGWNDLLGSSVVLNRLFSVLTSLLCLPLMYWLAVEIFEKPLVGFVAIAVLAVSPFHILYAQEARPYSLWTLTTLLSCVLLLQAQKRSTWLAWSYYCLSATASVYTFLFAIFTSLAQGIYIFLSARDKLSQTVLMYGLSCLGSLAAFSPWLWILLKQPPSNYAAIPHDSVWDYPKGWLRNLSLPFADFGINEKSPMIVLILFSSYLILLFLIILYAYIYLHKTASKKAFIFLSSLLVVPFLVLLIYDISTGGQTTTRGSYLIPAILSIQMTFAYLMANKMIQARRLWIVTCLSVLGISAASSFVLANANTWWHKVDENIHHKVAAIVNQEPSPLVISDVEFSLPISLSYSLKPETQYVLLPTPDLENRWHLPEVSYQDFSGIYLYRPSEQLQTAMQRAHDFELVPLLLQIDTFCDCPPEVLVQVNNRDR